MLRALSPLPGGAPTFGGRISVSGRVGFLIGERESVEIKPRGYSSSRRALMKSADFSEDSGGVLELHSTSVPLSNGEIFTVSGDPALSSGEFSNAVGSSLFKTWLKNMQSDSGLLSGGHMSLKHVHIQGLDMFGSRLGFVKFKADVIDNETGQKVPGIVFSRGPAVAVLIILKSGGKDFVVLTEQARVPVGRVILELPAGMLDDDGDDVVGTAVREVEEETGISLSLADMINLTALLDPATGCKIFPSPGGCDEEISLLLYKGNVDEGVIRSLRGKQMGLRDHGELIKVHVIPYQKLWRTTADAKVLAAIALYEMAKRDGLLPT
ncbi:nudix hydrolase homolog 14 [Wolffia australiana]